MSYFADSSSKGPFSTASRSSGVAMYAPSPVAIVPSSYAVPSLSTAPKKGSPS